MDPFREPLASSAASEPLGPAHVDPSEGTSGVDRALGGFAVQSGFLVNTSERLHVRAEESCFLERLRAVSPRSTERSGLVSPSSPRAHPLEGSDSA